MQWFYWPALGLILLLSGYAGWLLGVLWQQRRRRRRMDLLRRQQACDSLEIIARSLVAGQVNVTEAALRMAVLLDYIPEPSPGADVAAIHALAADSRHFATGKARARLTPGERARQDDVRDALEARYEVPVTESARRLLEVLPAWRR